LLITKTTRFNTSLGRTKTNWVAAILLASLLLFAADCRRPESEVDHLAEVLALKPGSSVADVGAGSGEVSIALAPHVAPGGRVYATEIDPAMLRKIRAIAQKATPGTFIPVAGAENDTGLPEGCCDSIFLREVYHHLTDPIAIDRSLYKAMRPGGRLAIIDFEPTPLAGPAPVGVPANRGGHGVPERLVEKELTTSGFELAERLDWPISSLIKHFCVVFLKPVDRGAATTWFAVFPTPMPFTQRFRTTPRSTNALWHR
jgi:SAM-dependent methyltransferase